MVASYQLLVCLLPGTVVAAVTGGEEGTTPVIIFCPEGQAAAEGKISYSNISVVRAVELESTSSDYQKVTKKSSTTHRGIRRGFHDFTICDLLVKNQRVFLKRPFFILNIG